MKRTVVERMPFRPGNLYYHEHMARYRFTQAYLQPGWTLDIACGTGYGTLYLANCLGSRVIGADIAFPALAQAREDYPQPGHAYIVADGVRLPFPDHSFQNIVSLETIEHIQDDRGFLGELSRLLRPGGVCVLSTPNLAHSVRHRLANPYHVREYEAAAWQALLESFFGQISVFYQGFGAHYYNQIQQHASSIQTRKRDLNPVIRLAIDRIYRPAKRMVPPAITNFFIGRMLGTTFPQPDLADIVISPDPPEDPNSLIAVCRQPAAL